MGIFKDGRGRNLSFNKGSRRYEPECSSHDLSDGNELPDSDYGSDYDEPTYSDPRKYRDVGDAMIAGSVITVAAAAGVAGTAVAAVAAPAVGVAGAIGAAGTIIKWFGNAGRTVNSEGQVYDRTAHGFPITENEYGERGYYDNRDVFHHVR